jgi:hypothetical protein
MKGEEGGEKVLSVRVKAISDTDITAIIEIKRGFDPTSGT